MYGFSRVFIFLQAAFSCFIPHFFSSSFSFLSIFRCTYVITIQGLPLPFLVFIFFFPPGCVVSLPFFPPMRFISASTSSCSSCHSFFHFLPSAISPSFPFPLLVLFVLHPSKFTPLGTPLLFILFHLIINSCLLKCYAILVCFFLDCMNTEEDGKL